ncbi:MAG: Crp/Fnr family transcriptional regulator [Patescibacteria group bacterium]
MDFVSYVKTLPVRSFSKDELLLASGDKSDTFFAVREGFIKATSTEDSGRQRLLWIAGRYDIAPLERFFTQKVLQYDYVGYSDGSAYVISKQALHALIKENSAAAVEIARGISEHFDDVSERLSAIGQADVRRKLLHTVYGLATKFSSQEIVKLDQMGLNLTHQDLADMIGASREVVSVELSKARSDGFVDYSRSTFTVNTAKIRSALNLLA